MNQCNVPTNGYTYSQCIPIPTQYTNHWYESNVVWAGVDGSTVYFNTGGLGQICYDSNVNLYQGPLVDNTAESSNVAHSQMYTVQPVNTENPYDCYSWAPAQLYQGFQT
ncbi:hypothetical protein [Caldivirga sp. UBA161]|uniref:hypothetical protein n=1 Tax=Caldivirga sp. UBA161 TaxID=1915569 RepID=UPI0025C5154A|nr:hypothetical protein [Caldivirga sp. UBA161]